MKYQTSTDYERLWELAMSGERIFCTVDYDWGDGKIMRDGARAKKTEYAVEIGVRGMCYLSAGFGEKEIFIAWCAKLHVEFIDPASQQNQQTFDCIPNMSLEDALKHIPGGAQIDMEERFVESIAWECNGEPMHECWRENETPMDAILRLYARAKRAECGIEKTPAELAAGEMAEVLQWALDAMPQSSFHAEYVHHFCVALAEKADEILKKASGK